MATIYCILSYVLLLFHDRPLLPAYHRYLLHCLSSAQPDFNSVAGYQAKEHSYY